MVAVVPLPESGGGPEARAFWPPSYHIYEGFTEFSSPFRALDTRKPGNIQESLWQPPLQKQCQCRDVMDGFNMLRIGMHASCSYDSCGIVNVVILLNMSSLHVQYEMKLLKLPLPSKKL